MIKSNISVLVVEDYEPFRQFINATFQEQSYLQVLGEVSDGAEAVRQAQQMQPDLVLLDIGLPTLNGIEVARRIRKVSPMSKILFVSENRFPDIAEEALRAGGLGYVIKSDAAQDLLPAIESVFQGKRFVSASLSQILEDSGTRASASRHPHKDNPYVRFGDSALIPEFLASIIDSTAADFGNVQLFDSRNRVLRIVAQSGCEKEFLNYFDTVDVTERCVCGKAMIVRSRIVVADVATDPLFSSEARAVLLRAKARSVQSTPLIDPSENFVGMVSTHYRRSDGPSPYMWARVDELAATFLAKIEDGADRSLEK